MSGLQSINIFSIVGRWCYIPWRDLIGVPFSILVWCNSNPGREPFLSFLNFITPRLRVLACSLVCTYGIRDHHSLYSTYNRMLSQCFLTFKTREASPKGYDQSPPYSNWPKNFDYYLLAYKYNVQDVVVLQGVRRIYT